MQNSVVKDCETEKTKHNRKQSRYSTSEMSSCRVREHLKTSQTIKILRKILKKERKKPAGNSEQCDARRSERLQTGQHIVRIMLGTLADDAICKVNGGDTECPLQLCQLSRSSESTQFLCLRRDVALFDSTRAPDVF